LLGQEDLVKNGEIYPLRLRPHYRVANVANMAKVGLYLDCFQHGPIIVLILEHLIIRVVEHGGLILVVIVK
jgi:hypothetical protein